MTYCCFAGLHTHKRPVSYDCRIRSLKLKIYVQLNQQGLTLDITELEA